MENTPEHSDEHTGDVQPDHVVQPHDYQPESAPRQPTPPPQTPNAVIPPLPSADMFQQMRDKKQVVRTHWAGQVVFSGVGYAPAGFWLRAVAFAIDMLLLSLLHAILIEVAQVPKVDLEAMLSVMAALADEMMTSGFPSDQTFAMMDELQRPAIFSGWLRVAMCGIYFTLFHGLIGQSLGKLCVGIRVLRKNGQSLGLGLAALRYLGYFLTSRLLHTAWILPFDHERRTLYDMALGTNVYREISPKQSSG